MAAGLISEDNFKLFVDDLLYQSYVIEDQWMKYKHGERTYLCKKMVKRIALFKEESTNVSDTVEIEVHEEEVEALDGACYTDNDSHEALAFEYHILYSDSYSVPVMYFNVHKSDGKLLPLDQMWALIPSCYQDRLQHDRWTFLTQQEHPYLGRPFYQIHPCHTESLMSCVEAIAQQSNVNYLISWLSVMGPVVCLDVPMAYGQLVAGKGKEKDKRKESEALK